MSGAGKISVPVAILMNINVIIGVGIYVFPPMMAQTAGNFSFLGWAAAGLLLFPVVWTIALAARMFPGAGGFYNYCSQGIGSSAGFLALWSYILGFFAVAAMQLSAFRDMLGSTFDISQFISSPAVVNLLLIVILALLNALDVGVIGRIQGVATLLKLAPMIAVIAIIPFYWNSEIVYGSFSLFSVASTVPMALFGYWGFESCSSISQYLKGGTAKTSQVILAAFFLSATLYTVFHFGLMHIMGTGSMIAQGAKAFPDFLGFTSPALLAWVKGALLFALLLALFNAVYGVMLSNISSLMNLASKGHLVASGVASRVNRFDRPLLLVLVQCLVMFLLMTFLPFPKVLVSLSNFGLIMANVLTGIAVFNVQLRQKSFGQLIVTILSFASCIIMAYFSWLQVDCDVMNVLPYVGALLLGYVMFRCTGKTRAA